MSNPEDDQGRPARPSAQEQDGRTGRSAAAARMHHQAQWVDVQLRQAIERGDFEDLPGFGKPIRIQDEDDPDWWVRQLVEREQVTGVLPPALALRKEDAALDEALDRLASEREVRSRVEDFNARVLHARYGNPGGPPLVTMPRDGDDEVRRWRERREARLRSESSRGHTGPEVERPVRRRWWRRR